jgi:hypothetical protein
MMNPMITCCSLGLEELLNDLKDERGNNWTKMLQARRPGE